MWYQKDYSAVMDFAEQNRLYRNTSNEQILTMWKNAQSHLQKQLEYKSPGYQQMQNSLISSLGEKWQPNICSL